MFLLLLMALVLPIMAQDVEPPTNWIDLLGNMDTWLGTLAGFAAATVFIGSVVTSLFKVSKNWLKQILVWIVAVLLCGAGNIANFGLMADATILQTVAYGIGAGLIANGFFDITFVRALLVALKLEVKK